MCIIWQERCPREEHPHLVWGIDCGGTIGSMTAPAPAPAFILMVSAFAPAPAPAPAALSPPMEKTNVSYILVNLELGWVKHWQMMLALPNLPKYSSARILHHICS